MRTTKRSGSLLGLVVGLLALGATSGFAAHEKLWAVTVNNDLISFFSDAPATIVEAHGITGLADGSEEIRGIDFNAADGQLYGIGSSSRLYTINPATGAATQVGTGQFSTLLNGQSFGLDNDPAGLGLVVVSDLRQNLTVNRATGVATVGPSVNPGTPVTTALAYDATTATWYAGNSLANTFGTFNPATGVYTSVGAAGIDFSRENGLDISPATGIMYLASPAASSDPAANLYTVNKPTGAVTLVGLIGNPGENILLRGLAVAP